MSPSPFYFFFNSLSPININTGNRIAARIPIFKLSPKRLETNPTSVGPPEHPRSPASASIRHFMIRCALSLHARAGPLLSFPVISSFPSSYLSFFFCLYTLLICLDYTISAGNYLPEKEQEMTGQNKNRRAFLSGPNTYTISSL